jgi:hypothetical protein
VRAGDWYTIAQVSFEQLALMQLALLACRNGVAAEFAGQGMPASS